MKTILAVLVLLVYGNRAGKAEAYRDQEHVNNNKVFVITLDGFRWQELFGGADPALLRPLTGTNSAGSGWLHPDPEQRREQLMPFMWRMVAAKGLLIGNRKKGSRLNVANPYALSYAGYNELFTGKPDYAIWRNERVVNRNRTILEYLNGLPSLKGKIGSIGSWSLFPYIFNKQRSHIYLDAAGTEGAVRHDTVTFNAARQYIRNHMPRVMHLGFGGTDEAGHQRNYGEYLTQAHLADSLIGELWQLVQVHPFYKDQTTFIITTDHGRGSSRANWHKHGFFIPGSAQTWLALIGNEVAPLGEHTRTEQLYSSQVAGTIGALLRVRHFGSRALPLSFFNTNKAGSSDALVGGP